MNHKCKQMENEATSGVLTIPITSRRLMTAVASAGFYPDPRRSLSVVTGSHWTISGRADCRVCSRNRRGSSHKIPLSSSALVNYRKHNTNYEIFNHETNIKEILVFTKISESKFHLLFQDVTFTIVLECL